MSAALLLDCLQRGAQFWAEGGDLRLRAPKDALPESVRGALKEKKSELLGILGEGRRFAAVSYAQRRLWFIDRFQPGSDAYTIESAFRLRGAVAPEVLAAALRDLTARHETLRTVIGEADGQPVQIVYDRMTAPLTVADIEVRGPEGLERYLRTELVRTFVLDTGPLFRAILLRLGEGDACLVFQIHHIVADGWSMRVLLRDFAAAYAARAAGRAPEWTALPYHYAEWARRQTLRVESDAEGHTAYWSKRLAGRLPVLDIATDYPRNRREKYAGGRVFRTMTPEAAAPFRDVLKGEGATAFMGILAAYSMLLRGMTGRREMLIGYPVAGRDADGAESLIGLFANMLPMRIAVSESATFRSLLRDVKAVALDGLAHQETPFEKLVEIAQPDRDTGRHPLVQTMFAMQNFARADFALPGVEAEYVRREDIDAKFDLALIARESDGGLELRLDFDASLFAGPTAERMLERLERLIVNAAAQPDALVDDLSMLTETDERDLARYAESREYGDVADMPPAHRAFAEQARRTPDRTAIAFRGAAWSYHRLECESNRLARLIQSYGLPRESLVGVCLEPSPWMIAALLAVWKAGHAYVPLDPRYPQARLDDMALQAKLPLTITSAACAGMVPERCGERIVLEAEAERIAAQSADPLLAEAEAGALAYTIFTSGSTGRPKGVQVEHGAFANFLASMRHLPGLNGGDVVLAITTLAFDIAGLELFLPLVSGATVALAERSAASDPAALAAALKETKATVLQATPATYRMLLDWGWRGAPGLRLFCGGEAMSRDLAGRLLETGAEVWNLYGPTETTVWSTVCLVAPDAGAVPIGRPIRNTRIRLLDERRAPVPPGVPGELYIGGAGLARGYLDLPELTAERFMADPFSPGDRLYRTGDLARFRHDGALEYLGRTDVQIKLRGFRIEPREIEAALERDDRIQEAVVALRRGAGGEMLTAYCRTSGEDASPDALRARLAAVLPAYMVPARFVFVEAFPLTPSGKIDRAALPEPEAPRTDAAETFQAPRDGVEADVANLFGEVLGVSPVGASDNFFYLGGHSLLATQLNSRIRERFRVELPLHAFFSAPTPAAVAEAIAAHAPRGESGGIRPTSRSLAEQLEQLEHFAHERNRLETIHGE